MTRKSRRLGIDLTNDEARVLLSTYIKLAACRPKQLFKVSKIDKNNCTSNWADIKFNYELLSHLLDVIKGRNIKARIFTQQLDTFLRANDMVWSLADVEAAVKGLKVMLSTLGALARDANRRPPRSYECLMGLVSKMVPQDFEEVCFRVGCWFHQGALTLETLC